MVMVMMFKVGWWGVNNCLDTWQQEWGLVGTVETHLGTG